MSRDYLLGENIQSMKDVGLFMKKVFDVFPLPKKKSSLILIKPNFHSDESAFTGGTTDFRTLAGLVMELQRRGYKNLVVGEGCSAGFLNAGIDTFERLGVDELCKELKVDLVDFHKSKYKIVSVGGQEVKVARECFDADFFINLPCIKTHVEAGMSCCMKNLMGCTVGSMDRQKIHDCLGPNIVGLHDVILPDLNIVDGIISMEGDGPSAGDPINTKVLLAGRDAHLLDYVVSRRYGISAPYVKDYGFSVRKVLAFKAPNPSFFYWLINLRFRKFFVKVRYSFLFKLLSSEWMGDFMKLLHVRQDRFVNAEKNIELFPKTKSKRVIPVCPLGYSYDKVGKCRVKCLYCLIKDENVGFSGDLGYFQRQVDKYFPL